MKAVTSPRAYWMPIENSSLRALVSRSNFSEASPVGEEMPLESTFAVPLATRLPSPLTLASRASSNVLRCRSV